MSKLHDTYLVWTGRLSSARLVEYMDKAGHWYHAARMSHERVVKLEHDLSEARVGIGILKSEMSNGKDKEV